MAQNITLSAADMVKAAKSAIKEYTVEEVQAMAGDDNVVLVDIRDPRELSREGRMPGAFHCPRGMLEFWIDPESPYAKPQFQTGNRFVFYCASGWRSALSALVAQNMGLTGVTHIDDGFSGWKKAGGIIAHPPSRDKS